MSEEQLSAFLGAVKADAGLQEKLKSVTNADAVVEIAKASGFVISADDLKQAQTEVPEDEELEAAAGGKLNRGALGACVARTHDGGYVTMSQ